MKLNDLYTYEWIIKESTHKDFISISNDRNPMHVDSKFALKYGFKQKIVHGNLLNIYLSYTIGELIPKKNVVIIDQTIKYKSPLFIGMSIKINLQLINIVESVNILKFKFIFSEKFTDKKIAIGHITIKELS